MLAVDRLRQLGPAPDVVAFTGDLADRAEPAAYARLRALVEPVVADLAAAVMWTMGPTTSERVRRTTLWSAAWGLGYPPTGVTGAGAAWWPPLHAVVERLLD